MCLLPRSMSSRALRPTFWLFYHLHPVGFLVRTPRRFWGRLSRRSDMDIKRVGSQPSGKGSAEYFAGVVRIDPLFSATAPARAVGNSVTFEPGARTAWHTHPLGQTLIVT